MTDISTFQAFYQKIYQIINQEIDKYNKFLLSEKTEEIKEAFQELTRLNTNGKCLRSILVALGYKCTGKRDNKYIPLALAIELFQTSILIHDDIIDEATLRRGQNTIPLNYKEKYNKKSSTKYLKTLNHISDSMAICIADLGLYEANKIIIDSYQDNLQNILSLYNNMVINTIKGELLDIILPFKEQYITTSDNLEQKVFEIYKLKTAYYTTIGPFLLGMTLGNAKEDYINQLKPILLKLGIAFQIKDDILGIYSNEGELGKTNSDITEYKQTILYAYTINTKYKKELKQNYGHSTKLNKIQKIFIESGAKEYAEKTMEKLFHESITDLNSINFISKSNKQIIFGFIEYLKNRTK